MFKLFGGKPNPMKTFGDLKRLVRAEGVIKGGETIRKAALDGSLICQRFMSQAGLSVPLEDRPDHVRRDTELFTRLAAEGGDPESQFNLAKIYIDQVDSTCEYWSEEDLQRIDMAKHWHRQAAAQQFAPSIQSLKSLLDAFPD